MFRIFLLSTVLGFVTSLTIDVRDQQTSQLGDASTILHCSYSGVPAGALALTLEWKKILDDGSSVSLASKAMPNGRPTFLNNRYAIVDTGSLRIANVIADDDGDYTCNVRYIQGKLVKESATTRLVVVSTETEGMPTEQPIVHPTAERTVDIEPTARPTAGPSTERTIKAATEAMAKASTDSVDEPSVPATAKPLTDESAKQATDASLKQTEDIRLSTKTVDKLSTQSGKEQDKKPTTKYLKSVTEYSKPIKAATTTNVEPGTATKPVAGKVVNGVSNLLGCPLLISIMLGFLLLV
ncbi:uncharacterized protein [Ptychodera flava]|uniref:uncharacterized protein n=1 Tax=Ptychodera flava TaxID=63121 RepID=UPI00396A0034